MAFRASSTDLALSWAGRDSRWWLRPALVLSALLASAYLGRRPSFQYLGVLVGIGLASVFLRWPPLGLVALVVASLVVPVSIGTGTQTSLNATVLLLALLIALWLLSMLLRREARLLPSHPIAPLLAFVGAATVAFAAGTQPWIIFAQTAPLATQAGGLAMFVLSAGAFLLVAHQIQDERWLRWLTWTFLILGGLYVGGAVTRDGGRLTGRLFQRGADGGLFWTWLVVLAFSQAAFNRQLNLVWRLMLGGIIVTVFYIRLIQAPGWTSGWLPPLLAIVTTLLAGSPRLGVLATFAVGLAIARSPDESIALLMSGDNEYSKTTRLEAWTILAELVRSSNPVLGLGPANYYWYTPLIPIEGYYVKFNSHNNYVDIVAQTGLLGLGCFLWFAAALGWLGWRLRTRVRTGFARAYVYGALGGLVGTLVAGMLGDWIVPFVYNIGFEGFRASVLGWLFLGGLISLERIANREASAPRPPDDRSV